MAQTIIAEATLYSASYPHLSRHTSVFSILVSSFIALLGIGCLCFSLDMDMVHSTMSMILLTVGTALILLSLYRIFWKSSEVVYLPTGSVVTEGSCYVDVRDLKSLEEAVHERNFSNASSVSFKHSGNVRMDYMLSKDRKFAAVQLFRFVPYTYEPATAIYYYTGDDAASFAHYLCTQNI